MTTARRALWFAAVVSVLAVAVVGSARSVERRIDRGSRDTVHQVVADHGAVVSVHPVADRPVLEVREVRSGLVLVAWISVLLIAAVLARTEGRDVERRRMRAGSAVPLRHRVDRGPPATTFA